MGAVPERQRHWDAAYGDRGVTTVSWFQPEPAVSLELLHVLAVDPGAPVIDVGGGASPFVDRLVGEGYGDVSVLDVSEVALDEARRRLGPDAAVSWIHEDVLRWRPARRYGLWHDRALFHFLTADDDRTTYGRVLRSAVTPGGGVIVGTFAEDGPEYCSGLQVTRYSASQLAGVLGASFEVVATRHEVHTTPAGLVQPFTWVAGRMG